MKKYDEWNAIKQKIDLKTTKIDIPKQNLKELLDV
jgi:hypothetical protein